MAKSLLVQASDYVLMAPFDVMDGNGYDAYDNKGLRAIFKNVVSQPFFKIGALTAIAMTAFQPDLKNALWAAFSLTSVSALITVNDHSDICTNALLKKLGATPKNIEEVFFNTTVSKDEEMASAAANKMRKLRNSYIGKAVVVLGSMFAATLTEEFKANGNITGLSVFASQAATYLLTQAYHAQRILKQDWTLCDSPPDRKPTSISSAAPTPA